MIKITSFLNKDSKSSYVYYNNSSYCQTYSVLLAQESTDVESAIIIKSIVSEVGSVKKMVINLQVRQLDIRTNCIFITTVRNVGLHFSRNLEIYPNVSVTLASIAWYSKEALRQIGRGIRYVRIWDSGSIFCAGVLNFSCFVSVVGTYMSFFFLYKPLHEIQRILVKYYKFFVVFFFS